MLGAAIAYILFNGYTVSTLAGGSFSQTAFAFAVTGEVVQQGLTLALFVGFIGGVFQHGMQLGEILLKLLDQSKKD